MFVHVLACYHFQILAARLHPSPPRTNPTSFSFFSSMCLACCRRLQILYDNLLNPVLNIGNPRADERIKYGKGYWHCTANGVTKRLKTVKYPFEPVQMCVCKHCRGWLVGRLVRWFVGSLATEKGGRKVWGNAQEFCNRMKVFG